MANLLKQITEVDFRMLAKLDARDEETKLKVSDHLVLVAEQVLTIARRNHWSLCRRFAFFYLFNGAFWRVVDKDDLRRFLGQAAEQMGIKWLMARSVDFTKKLFDQFSETAYLPAPAISRDVIKINLLNGTFKFGPDGQQLCEPQAADFLTHQLQFSYDADAKAPLFEKFLNKVQPDLDCQKLLAEYIGYVFVSPSQLKMEKAMLLYGSGANGKSVFFEIIMGLLGTENVSNYSFEKLTTEPAYRAQIANKLLNYASEISGNLESTVFKALASGEPVEARLLYGQAFTMTDYAKLLANTNELPAAPEHSHAYFRRFLIVPFTVTIPDHEQDKQLAAKIIANELPGVFNWVLAGLRRLLAQGRFTDPAAVRHQLEVYRSQSDTARLFIDENAYQADLDRYTTLQELYREYKSFCAEDGYRPVKKLNFRKRLESYGFRVDEKNVGKVVYVVRAVKTS
ncbi:DNA primase [Spirosoma terrae]|uniref:DNA primase n=2 Tax=Spirosoma terrae TaxID=1968276 RepID=A0A6L9L6W7_9BACT|nr:DNA primase [Spirosoma terrae]